MWIIPLVMVAARHAGKEGFEIMCYNRNTIMGLVVEIR